MSVEQSAEDMIGKESESSCALPGQWGEKILDSTGNFSLVAEWRLVCKKFPWPFELVQD